MFFTKLCEKKNTVMFKGFEGMVKTKYLIFTKGHAEECFSSPLQSLLTHKSNSVIVPVMILLFYYPVLLLKSGHNKPGR